MQSVLCCCDAMGTTTPTRASLKVHCRVSTRALWPLAAGVIQSLSVKKERTPQLLAQTHNYHCDYLYHYQIIFIIFIVFIILTFRSRRRERSSTRKGRGEGGGRRAPPPTRQRGPQKGHFLENEVNPEFGQLGSTWPAFLWLFSQPQILKISRKDYR